MAEAALPRSALTYEGDGAPPRLEGLDVRLVEQPHTGKVILRGDAGDPMFLGAVRGALELDLPLAPNTSSETPPVSALWLGPDEWMLICAPGSEAAVAESLRAGLGGQHAAVVDISDAQTVLQLSGRSARTVLAKGCALDLHPSAFSFGDVAQAFVAKASVTLHQTADEADEGGPSFDIYVSRSFADYLWRWIQDAIN